jgi:hypothetical protein
MYQKKAVGFWMLDGGSKENRATLNRPVEYFFEFSAPPDSFRSPGGVKRYLTNT